MKTRLLLPCAACLLGLAALSNTARAQATATTPPPAAPGAPHTPVRNRHPAIHSAIGALERAKAEMQAAAHDYGGHRVEAIAACDAAIAQLRLALQYANQAPPGAHPTP